MEYRAVSETESQGRGRREVPDRPGFFLARRSFIAAAGIASLAGGIANWRRFADDDNANLHARVVAVLDGNQSEFRQYEALISKMLIPSVVLRDDLATLWMGTLGRLVSVNRPVIIGRTSPTTELAVAMLAQDFGYRQRSPVKVARDTGQFWVISPDRYGMRDDASVPSLA